MNTIGIAARLLERSSSGRAAGSDNHVRHKPDQLDGVSVNVRWALPAPTKINPQYCGPSSIPASSVYVGRQ